MWPGLCGRQVAGTEVARPSDVTGLLPVTYRPVLTSHPSQPAAAINTSASHHASGRVIRSVNAVLTNDCCGSHWCGSSRRLTADSVRLSRSILCTDQVELQCTLLVHKP